MKRIFLSVIAALFSVAMLSAQTAEDIIARMDAEMDKSDQTGLSITMEMGVPIIGKITARINTHGDYSRTEMSAKDLKSTLWSDGTTTWTYTPGDNELVIDKVPESGSSNEDNVRMLKGITSGYDVKLTKETADAWYFDCKKSKSNTDKDDPKNMTLVVAKGTYMPLELSTKIKGIAISLKDPVLGVSEADVKFDMSKVPAGVKVTDKR